MKKVFAEIGFGNDSFFSTEIEEGGNEYRILGFIKPQKIHDYYFRVWLFKRELIISNKDGLIIRRRDKNKLKILFGISGC